MNKILIITGLTCSGKSSLAVEVAKSFNGEIISADSVQVYKGLDIGSAKVDLETRNKIPHYLIDIRESNENYNVSEFVEDCKTSINQIINKGKLPIIVGGTALYLKALMEGYSLGNTNSHQDFRERYLTLAKDKGNQAVWEELNKLNPEKAKGVHPNNIKRVVRYLEIETFGETQEKSSPLISNYDVLAIGIVDDRESIYNRINERVDEMVSLGLEDEIKKLIKSGAKPEFQSMQAIGYKEWFDYFDGKIDRDTTINLIKQHTRNYCKRQLTFLKTVKNLKICTVTEAKKLIKEFL